MEDPRSNLSKTVEFVSSYWARVGFQSKNSTRSLTKLYLSTQQQIMKMYTLHKYVKNVIYMLQWLYGETQIDP